RETHQPQHRETGVSLWPRQTSRAPRAGAQIADRSDTVRGVWVAGRSWCVGSDIGRRQRVLPRAVRPLLRPQVRLAPRLSVDVVGDEKEAARRRIDGRTATEPP